MFYCKQKLIKLFCKVKFIQIKCHFSERIDDSRYETGIMLERLEEYQHSSSSESAVVNVTAI